MHKLNKILTIGLLFILFSLSGYSQGTKIETAKLIISNDFEVVSNATFNGSVDIGGINLSSTNPPASTNLVVEQVDAEKSRATNEEYLIRLDLTNEYSRATNEEAVLQAGINTVKLDLTNEYSRATNEEYLIRVDLTNEYARATNEEHLIRVDLTNEYSRATNVETVISNWADATFFSSNESPTMAGSTIWTFSRANVTNTATTDTQVVNYKTGTNLWEETMGPTVGNNEINLSFANAATPYLDVDLIGVTYMDVAYIIFSGSSEWGTPDKLNILVGCEDGSPALNFRLYDVSNAKTIVTYTNFTTIAATLLTVTNLTNIPTNTALIAFQGSADSGSANNLHLYSIKLMRTSYLKR